EIRQRKDDAYISFVEPLYDLPLTDKVVLRTQVPYVVNNPADAPSTDGLGDITNVLSYRYFSGAGRSYDVGLEVRWNTASAPELGVGNTLLAPTWFGSITVPKYNTILFPLVQTFISVDRDEGRRKLHYTVLKGRFLTKLENRYYIYVEPVIYVQHRRDNETTGTLELEFGRFVNAQTMLYLRPGAGLWGNVGSPYLFEWNFEVGYRYFFK
ncbi:MAG: hypothetical protein GTO41_08430, partial [Burkholderiales bacterium]|nr:hypothetical protein [Burkholderiales bacterium]